MIGVGVDIVQISSFKQQLDDPASVFTNKTFTPLEIQYSQNHVSKRPEQHLSARFAAKEAFVKAWSSLYRFRPPIVLHPDLQEIEICNDRYGRPYIELHGQVKEVCAKYSMQLSLSHDGDYALAQVILQERSGDNRETEL